VSASQQVGQGAVVVAATHPDAVGGAVEPHHRDQQEVEVPGGAEVASACLRFGDAESIGVQALVRRESHEPEPGRPLAVVPPTQDGEVGHFAARQRRPDERARIQLSVAWPVGRDPPCTLEGDIATKQSREASGVGALTPIG